MKRLSNEIILKNTVKIKNALKDSNIETLQFIREKTLYFQEIMRNTILSVQQFKKHDIFSNSDVNICIQNINDLYEKTTDILENIHNIHTIERTPDGIIEYTEKNITLLQNVIDKLSIIICSFGTKTLDDLLYICIGSKYMKDISDNIELQDKIELIRKYVKPIGYKSVSASHRDCRPFVHLCTNKIVDDIVYIERSYSYECYDIDNQPKSNFFSKINGIRVVIQNRSTQKALIITGIVDDILIKTISNKYINKRRFEILSNIPEGSNIDKYILTRYLDMMTLKDFLIFGTEDIYKKYWLVMKDICMIKENKPDYIIKKFVEMDIYAQRDMIINLLSYNIEDEVKYMTYLLYDVITANNIGGSNQNYIVGENMDTKDQILIYDSLSWPAKIHFKDVMKFTVKYTQDMVNKYDINRISIEQQIYLMKVPEYIKEKAMVKLKEIKGKSDDSSSKAKQYLEGLLKIPFGVYKEEHLLKIVKTNNAHFIQLLRQLPNDIQAIIPQKPKYTNIELLKYSSIILKSIERNYDENVNLLQLFQVLSSVHKKCVLEYIKSIITRDNITYSFPLTVTKKTNTIIENFVNNYPQYKTDILSCIAQYNPTKIVRQLSHIIPEITTIKDSVKIVEMEMNNITDILNQSIYGHDYAKNQILKIIGQWMNGEQNGYCFGFEGSPGVGKTSVAKKGLAKCLIDQNGQSRPFAFIALGGSCNGSTLEGHSYTYVNSIWGRITDILMESKCMNPIIYIDELDKVSKTEHGKEIIGILTHLIDTTQNDCFQDKYYNGINLDLSKALFIFSYNDPDNIDRILLDRIHRIRFNNLTLDDKMIIVKEYILKEINTKMGFSDIVSLDDKIIEYIIETYTLEPGVRKLKEVLFDLFGEINLELLKSTDESIIIPINITIEDLETKYLKKYNKIQITKVPSKSEVGVINGLWANALGKGGIIPIETMFFPASSFLELRLTGLQGDVMKESMNVAKSLAWKLTSTERKRELIKQFDETKCQGLHIHCPEGAVSKDGPSAGTGITIAIYSLLNNIPINNTLAITGEINLQGQVSAIGGLDCKILGGIKAGVKTFLYPESNVTDYNDFLEKYAEKSIVDGIQFFEINTIEQALSHVFSDIDWI
jgi:ATP-dependent Lon protease